MYILDDVAYAGEVTPLLKIAKIRALSDYKLFVVFNNNTMGIFDFKPFLEEIAFEPLKEISKFQGVYLEYGVPVWENGEIDIAPEFIIKSEYFQTLTASEVSRLSV
ncbi:MAG: DUF2442 domain-containing protein [Oscillospiraceae bacterium]|jgi:hypothetical protein|nr:DUF2442 domain-containing protein [Oscillospiraceae bacterium]